MRNRLTILLLLCAMAMTAQRRLDEPELYFGVHAGASTVVGDWKFAPAGGLVFQYTNQKYCGLQLELNYCNQRVDIPMLMHLHFGRKAQVAVNLGPEIGLRVTDARFYYGQTGGVGVQLYTRRAGVFDLDVRYMLGMRGMEHQLGAHLGWFWPMRRNRQTKKWVNY